MPNGSLEFITGMTFGLGKSAEATETVTGIVV
jgi:hypothetical protein